MLMLIHISRKKKKLLVVLSIAFRLIINYGKAIKYMYTHVYMYKRTMYSVCRYT